MNDMWQVKIGNRRPLVYSQRKDAEEVYQAKVPFVGVFFFSVELERVDPRDVDPRDIVR